MPETGLPVLVDKSICRHVLRLGDEEVMEMVDTGELRWVFDVASGDARRVLRFWFGEVLRPRTHDHRTLAEVVEMIAGHKTEAWLRTGTVMRTLWLHRQNVHDLIEAEELRAEKRKQTMWVERASLLDFLQRRWQGRLEKGERR